MDLSSPTPNSPLTPVFGDNVQDLLNAGALNVNPSAIIMVNSTNDALDDLNSGVTTLRDAINQANADNGSDLIVFDRSVFSNAQTITLSLGELDLTHNLDIIAPRDTLTGADLVTVSGNKASRVFEIETGATVSLDGLIVADGRVTRDPAIGGGIKNSGTLTLDNSTISGNTSSNGGGINNVGTLTVNNSRVSDNSAGENGGGISSSGTLTINNSTISDNRCGIYSFGGGIEGSGILTVSNTTITGNQTSAGAGGGIAYNNYSNLNENMLTVNNSTISNNDAFYGGGISSSGMLNVNVSNSTLVGNSASLGGGIDGEVVLSNSTLSGNSAFLGGGIFGSGVVSNSTISNNRAEYGGGITSSGTLTVINSTISGNTATDSGGGISNGGTLTVSNSTLDGNSATDSGGGIFNGKNPVNSGGTVNVSNSTLKGNTAGSNGGGIFNDKTLTLVSSTLTLNSASLGGGMFNDALGNASTRNTIIAANLNSPNGVNADVSGTFTSNGYNLIGDSTGSTGFDATGDIVGTSDNPIDPRLAPLDFYGGSTQTFALLPDSPAIDAGDPTILDTDPTTDQRGLARVSGSRADIGAFEVQV